MEFIPLNCILIAIKESACKMGKIKFNLEKEVTKLDTKTLDKLTRDNFKPTKKETALIIELAFAEAGKEELSDKETREMINRVNTCMILELLHRQGLIKRNKKGFWDKTELGLKVQEYMEGKK